MQKYIEEMKLKPDDYLVTIKARQIRNVVRAAGERIGFGDKDILNPLSGKKHYVHPHSFRDSLAVETLSARPDLEGQKALQDHFGHARYDTTTRYFKLAPARVQGIMDDVRAKREAQKSE